MSNLTDIKHRIKSVSDTRKITSAMETISVSKMRKAMIKYENNRVFFDKIRSTIQDITLRTGDVSSIYFADVKEDSKVAYIVIASDKGLAGGFNNNVLKHAWDEIKIRKNPYIFTVGHIAREFFEAKKMMVDIEFAEAGFNPSKKDAVGMAETILKLYNEKRLDEVNIVYTKMINSNVMAPDIVRLLPFSKAKALKEQNEMTAEKEYALAEIEYDPSPEEVLEGLVPQYIKWVIYGTLIQSSASEHCSRRFAMSNATKNAGEILDNLNLVYNRARQEAVTNEITEIITSSMGVK